MALRRSLLRIDKASLLETFSTLKIRNFGYTPSHLHLLRKSMSNFSLFLLYSNFSLFLKIFTCKISIFPCNIVVDIYDFFDGTKLCSAINKRNEELQHLSKELSLSENILSTKISTIDFYILTKSITSCNKKSLQKSLYTQ